MTKPIPLTKKQIRDLLDGTRARTRGARPKPTALALCAAHLGVSLAALGELLGSSKSQAVSWSKIGVPATHTATLAKLIRVQGKCIKTRINWTAVLAMAARAE